MKIGDFIELSSILDELEDDLCGLPQEPQQAKDVKMALFRVAGEMRRKLRALEI